MSILCLEQLNVLVLSCPCPNFIILKCKVKIGVLHPDQQAGVVLRQVFRMSLVSRTHTEVTTHPEMQSKYNFFHIPCPKKGIKNIQHFTIYYEM